MESQVRVGYEATSKGKKVRKMHDGYEPLSRKLDDPVYEFLQERRRFGLAVSNMALADGARLVAVERGIVGFKLATEG